MNLTEENYGSKEFVQTVDLSNGYHEAETWIYPFLRPSDARKPSVSYDWLVGNKLLPKSARAIMVGPKSSGKTGIVVDLLYFRSIGEDWYNTKISKGRSVLVLGEGANGVRKRIRALEQHHGVEIPEDRLLLVNYGVPINERAGIDGLKRTVDRYFRDDPPDLFVFDTLSMCLGKADENSNTHMRMMYNELDGLRVHYKATTMPLAHTGHNVDSGHARGASVLEDDAETVLAVDALPEKKSRLRVRKQKEEDAEDIPEMVFVRSSITLTTSNNMHELETSYILTPTTYTPPPVQQKQSDTRAIQTILENQGPLNNSELQAACKAEGIGQRRFEHARDTLVGSGFVTREDGEHNAKIYSVVDDPASTYDGVEAFTGGGQMSLSAGAED